MQGHCIRLSDIFIFSKSIILILMVKSIERRSLLLMEEEEVENRIIEVEVSYNMTKNPDERLILANELKQLRERLLALRTLLTES